MSRVVFIIGSPRSGTTILENILGCHPEIAEWYEPYYVWERFLSSEENDVWQIRKAASEERVRRHIRHDYRVFGELSRKQIVLDKLPTHVFNIAFIQSVFPEAKWIHIIRDGRDVALSIQKEWIKRKKIVEEKDIRRLYEVALKMLNRQPFLRYKLMAIFHELGSNASINPLRYFNKSRWNGKVGWGPRFNGWQEYLETHSTIEFNAMQWVKCVEAAQEGLSILPEENRIEIRYEELLQYPQETLEKVCGFIEIVPTNDFIESLPKLMTDNFRKWENAFTPQEKALIGPVLTDMLVKLGYENNSSWYEIKKDK